MLSVTLTNTWQHEHHSAINYWIIDYHPTHICVPGLVQCVKQVCHL
jgi:hypothetical protein